MSYLIHIGIKRRSGRYPWGSGENPRYLLELRARMYKLKKANPEITPKQMAKSLNISMEKMSLVRDSSFGAFVSFLKEANISESEMAEAYGMKSPQFRALKSIEKTKERAADEARARYLVAPKSEGGRNMSQRSAAESMGVAESTFRNLLNPSISERSALTLTTANILKEQIANKKYLDVGTGTEHLLGIPRNRLNLAVEQLKMEGYKLHYVTTPQIGTGKKTSLRVLTKDDVDWREVNANKEKIQTVNSVWSDDKGRTYQTLKPPVSVDSKRIMVRFSDDPELSGADMDGAIQLRRNVPDLSLGEKRYAQVRIAVDDKYYLKGMAIYSDNMPPGIDIIYNVSKSSEVGKFGAMKKMNVVSKGEDGGDIFIDKVGNQKLNEFGATIRQKTYIDSKGVEKQSALNVVGFVGKPGSGEEGSWDTWSRTLSAQFLSKQPHSLAKQQLNIAYDIQKSEFDKIMAIQQPVVRQKLLDSFADDCDSKAVHLKAARLPGQGSKVLIPIPSLKNNECYCPTYKNGEKLILVRYPHAGPFEIPVLTVNNNNPEGKSVLENSVDAIGLPPKAFGIMSGADADGDTALTIPFTSAIRIAEPFKELREFDPRSSYPKYEGMKVISNAAMQNEMGRITNLIQDMGQLEYDMSDMLKAVKHSMVVIDSHKHELNYKLSYEENDIAHLKKKYRGGERKGASSLISRSSAEIRVDARRPVKKEDVENNPELAGVIRRQEYSVDPKTGRKVWVPTGEGSYIDPETGRRVYVNPSKKNKEGTPQLTITPSQSGKVPTYSVNGVPVKFTPRKIKSTRMYETDDARSLSSGTIMDTIYAEYSNNMKALGDRARLESINTPLPSGKSSSAAETYAPQVSSLMAKLTIAQSNAPLERQATLIANHVVDLKRAANPNLTAADIKKIRGQAILDAREQVGANKKAIEIEPKEWEAINAGAVSRDVLSKIMSNTKIDDIKALALPHEEKRLTPALEARIRLLVNQKYTQAEIAEMLDLSTSTINKYVNE